LFTCSLPPEVIIETGTHLGTGSTKAIVSAYESCLVPEKLKVHTIEGNKEYYEKAKKNLEQYPYVLVHHGLTLDQDLMRDFISTDDFIVNHPKWVNGDVSKDADHINFYLDEISEAKVKTPEDNLLIRIIEKNSEERKLFFLDSAGGVGFLEFQTVTNYLRDEHYYLGLDDIDHIKHYRSWKQIMGEKGMWRILFNDGRTGLVEHLER
jgi:hypothetical protein